MSMLQRARPLAALMLACAALTWAPKASANGTYSHAHISQLAHAFLPPGELRDLFDNPDNVAAFENGSMFPDSGYAIDHPYGEFAHWARFRLAFLDYLRGTYEGDYSSTEAQRAVSFFLGVCSHSIADQSYDTTILTRAFEVDGPENDDFPVDQYADYFITIDQDIVFGVDGAGPFPALAQVLSESMGTPIEANVPMEGMALISAVAMIQGSPDVVGGDLYAHAWAEYPWLGTHIYNEVAVGSLPWLGALVAEQWQVLWRRLHNTDNIDEDLLLRTVPEDGGVNWPVNQDESEAYGRIA
ncbi:MAG: zinc dependent phospholipase C family protein, partial [Polyangiales bacterium]